MDSLLFECAWRRVGEDRKRSLCSLRREQFCFVSTIDHRDSHRFAIVRMLVSREEQIRRLDKEDCPFAFLFYFGFV